LKLFLSVEYKILTKIEIFISNSKIKERKPKFPLLCYAVFLFLNYFA
jgi:hypothetical protein